MTKDEVRAHARRLGLRTAGKPDSQDVCFIGERRGPCGFLVRADGAAPRRGGRRRGTAGRFRPGGRARHGGPAARHGPRQRRHAALRHARRRGGAAGDRGQRGRGAAVLGACLAGPSLTWVDQPLVPGARAVAQVSAHGRPVPCVLEPQPGDAGMEVRFDDPQRPVAPGQTVALYDAARPRRRRRRGHRRLTVAGTDQGGRGGAGGGPEEGGAGRGAAGADRAPQRAVPHARCARDPRRRIRPPRRRAAAARGGVPRARRRPTRRRTPSARHPRDCSARSATASR